MANEPAAISRPNWGVLGHEWAVDMLKEHIRRQMVRHAYLFCGPPGIGRRTLALRFAQALSCPHPPSPAEPCGKCRLCRQIEAMQYPDLTVVQAEKEGGVLKVEQVRAVRQSLSLKPYQGPYRFVLFLRFQEAHPSAANALLKTLEEAPSHAILLLTADQPEQLLPTIVSRCEVFRLRSLSLAQVEAYLQAHLAEAGEEESAGQARLLSHLSAGRPGYALRLLTDPDRLALRQQNLEAIATLLASNRRQRFAYAESLARNKEDLRQVLLTWLSYWRDVLLCLTQADIPLTNIDRAQEIATLATCLSFSQATCLVEELQEAVDRLDKNVNARLLMEVLLLNWPKVMATA